MSTRYLKWYCGWKFPDLTLHYGRLERLFLLVDTGSTPAIRKMAAQQLGEIEKMYPYELFNLLGKVGIDLFL